MSLTESVSSFAAGAGLWAAALVLISTGRAFPLIVRILGTIAAMFAITAAQIFYGMPLDVCENHFWHHIYAKA